MSTGSELSSLASSLDDVTRRITALADQLSGTDRDDVAHELYEVERGLQHATRRLEKVVAALGS